MTNVVQIGSWKPQVLLHVRNVMKLKCRIVYVLNADIMMVKKLLQQQNNMSVNEQDIIYYILLILFYLPIHVKIVIISNYDRL